MSDKFTSFGIIVDRKGREHKIYPAKLRWKDELRRLTAMFDDSLVMMNIMMPSRNEDGEIETDWEGNIEYSDEAYNAMMEVILMAFDYKYTLEQVEDFVDLGMIPEMLKVFYNLSGLKKKIVAE